MQHCRENCIALSATGVLVKISISNALWKVVVVLGDEMECLPGKGLNVDGKDYYQPGDKGSWRTNMMRVR